MLGTTTVYFSPLAPVTSSIWSFWTTLATWPVLTALMNSPYPLVDCGVDPDSHVYSRAEMPMTRTSINRPLRMNFGFKESPPRRNRPAFGRRSRSRV